METYRDLIKEKMKTYRELLKENAELIKENFELLQENDKLKKRCEFYQTVINLNANDQTPTISSTFFDQEGYWNKDGSQNLKVTTADNFTVTTTFPPGSGVC